MVSPMGNAAQELLSLPSVAIYVCTLQERIRTGNLSKSV